MKVSGTLPKITAMAGLIAAAGLVGTGAAHAGAMAVSIFEVNNFQVIDSTSGSQLTLSQVSVLGGNNSADTDASLNGVTAPQNAAVLVPIAPPGFGAIDLPQACIGTCPPFPENSYAGVGFTPPPTSTYALSDMQLSGTTVDTGVGNSGGVDAQTRADVSIDAGTNTGSSQTNAGTDVNFTFTALTDLTAQFTLDYILQLRAYLDTGTGGSGSAQASASWNLDLIDTTTGADVLTWAPTQINRSRTASLGPLTNLFVDSSGSLASDVFSLTMGDNYQLSIRHTSQADARFAAAEPLTVGLLGAGLAMLGLIRRRRA
jgi:hypothetical protein